MQVEQGFKFAGERFQNALRGLWCRREKRGWLKSGGGGEDDFSAHAKPPGFRRTTPRIRARKRSAFSWDGRERAVRSCRQSPDNRPCRLRTKPAENRRWDREIVARGAEDRYPRRAS